jgi:hypothetical protein
VAVNFESSGSTWLYEGQESSGVARLGDGDDLDLFPALAHDSIATRSEAAGRIPLRMIMKLFAARNPYNSRTDVEQKSWKWDCKVLLVELHMRSGSRFSR